VLDDPLSTTFPDADHSTGERRFFTIGMAVNEALEGVLNTTRAVRSTVGLPDKALRPTSRARRKPTSKKSSRAARG
jgi:uncharacterized DUF497 family protein